MELYDEEGNLIRVAEAKPGWWERWGGGSLLVAAVFHAILLVAGAFWVFKIVQEPEKKVDFMPPGGGGGERGAEHQIQKKRAQITPSTNVKRVFAEGAVASYALPEQGDSFGEMSALSSLSGGGMSGGLGGAGAGKGFGKGLGVGAGIGSGVGTGKLFGLIPENMRKRCSKEDRLQRLQENGGTPACDDAVVKGLEWLKANQNPDGSWGRGNKAGMTGLALLAYFGHCETPASTEFGESCVKGIAFLVGLGMQNDGKMASKFTGNSWVYEHAIATYALGEALTFCNEIKYPVPGLLEVTQKAGQFIIDNQNKKGGWAYMYATDGEDQHVDSSVTAWQLQALKACSHAKLPYKGLNSSVKKGLDYLSTLQNENGGIGYTNATNGAGKYFSLTGAGVLCFQMWGKESSKEVRDGLKYIKENTKFDFKSENSDLYQHYYESQAMMQAGGNEWKMYNELFRDQLLANQNPDGSWNEPGYTGHGIKGNEVYRNALCILMLEVYYRFLNTGGGSRSGRSGI